MNEPKALMTQYAEGCLISRELQQMMTDYAADARFERELTDDIDLYADRKVAEHKPIYKGYDLPVGGMFGAYGGEPDPDHD